MSKLFQILLSVCAVFLVVFSVLSFHSIQSLSYMDHGLHWLWVDSQLISLDTQALQSARERHSDQLIYRQVDIDNQLVTFLNTTKNGYFLFTFVKQAPCDASVTYQARLSVNNQPDKWVTFRCRNSNNLIYRIAKRRFQQLTLDNKDFQFDLDLAQWPMAALRQEHIRRHH